MSVRISGAYMSPLRYVVFATTILIERKHLRYFEDRIDTLVIVEQCALIFLSLLFHDHPCMHARFGRSVGRCCHLRVNVARRHWDAGNEPDAHRQSHDGACLPESPHGSSWHERLERRTTNEPSIEKFQIRNFKNRDF